MKKTTRWRRRLQPRRVGYVAVAGLLGLSVVTGDAPQLDEPAVPSFLETPASAVAAVHDDLQAVREEIQERMSTPFTEHADSSEVEWDVANLEHPRVDYWIERFQTDKKGDFERFMQRKGLYEPMILAKLEESGLPKDLLYLAMIESGFQAKAYSSAHASGIWQFIPDTGKRHGLEINRAVDERNDPEKSTEAAIKYLSKLHRRFDSWYLAAASYNTGENRVGRIMKRETGSERGEDADYYRIWDHLPKETRDYVPLMIAAARISKQPEKYGFAHVEPLPPLEYKTVKARPATPLSRIAKQAGTSVSELKKLNPELKLNRTRNDMTSRIRVPS